MYESDLLYLAIMLWTERYSHPLLIKETWEDGTVLKEKKQGARVLRLLSSLNLEPQMQCLFPAGSQTPGLLTRAHVFLGTRTGCIFERFGGHTAPAVTLTMTRAVWLCCPAPPTPPLFTCSIWRLSFFFLPES